MMSKTLPQMKPRRLFGAALAAVSFTAAALILTAAEPVYAQRCKQHFAEAFQLIAIRPLAGRSPADVKSTVDDVFGPRKDICGAGSYKYFLSELKNYASLALRKK